MTPKQKAQTLVKKYADELNIAIDHTRLLYNNAKHCAIVCCREVISEIEDLQQNCVMEFPMALEYWNSVKSEIEKL